MLKPGGSVGALAVAGVTIEQVLGPPLVARRRCCPRWRNRLPDRLHRPGGTEADTCPDRGLSNGAADSLPDQLLAVLAKEVRDQSGNVGSYCLTLSVAGKVQQWRSGAAGLGLQGSRRAPALAQPLPKNEGYDECKYNKRHSTSPAQWSALIAGLKMMVPDGTRSVRLCVALERSRPQAPTVAPEILRDYWRLEPPFPPGKFIHDISFPDSAVREL
ncbi:hypothetical protein [Mesorhizobium sp. B2-4-17]|uniref:hypothetical protein n=1 Tax=Mesorhizobium sp. B2-4-17 TaxID=2589932 RepID=UPI00112B8EF1|nr:hypothetical protein [Mesorhizobium sp. B2-4-17]TPK83048.1 hypothetical protein FJ548_19540 [Mesorhizobium sp. B2-4-17]